MNNSIIDEYTFDGYPNSSFDINDEDFTEEEIRFNRLVESTAHIVKSDSINNAKLNKQQNLAKTKKANRYGN